MQNIELKISINNFKDIINALRNIGSHYDDTLHQIDIYYFCKNGRLKLRNINNKNFELIFYQRPDKKIKKISNYRILQIKPNKFNSIELILDNALGKRIIVRKERKVWIYKNTRIHLDSVYGLGKFLELETVVKKINLKEAKREYNKVLKLLGLLKYEKCKESYSDLLENTEKRHPASFQMRLENLRLPDELFSSIRSRLSKL